MLAVLLTSATAAAQPASDPNGALSLYLEARQLFDDKQYAQACPKFEASLHLSPDDIDIRGMLALCFERVGKLASAWTQFRDVAVRSERANRADPLRVATEHIAALEPRLAKLIVKLGSTPGVIVKKDTVPLPADASGSGLAVDAGKLTLTADAPGYVAWKQDVIVTDGEVKTIEVPPLTRATTPPPPPSIQPGTPTMTKVSPAQRYVALGIGGAGLVALGIGVWAGIDARGKRDDAHSAGCNDDLSMCPTAALGTANAAFSRGHLSNAMFLGGGVLVGAAAVVWFLSPKSEKRPTTSWRLQPHVDPTAIGFTVGGSL